MGCPICYLRFSLYYSGMTLDALIMLSGALVAVLPFLGFPNSWDKVILVVTGIFIIALGIVVRRRGAAPAAHREVRDAHFVDTRPAPQPEPHENAQSHVG